MIATPFFQAKEPLKNQLSKTGIAEELYIIREYTPRAGAPKSENFQNPSKLLSLLDLLLIFFFILWIRTWPFIYANASFLSLKSMKTRNEFIWVLHAQAQHNVNVIMTSEIVLNYSTSFSQSHRAVMIAKITVWIAVPPKIIPPQIPCHIN